MSVEGNHQHIPHTHADNRRLWGILHNVPINFFIECIDKERCHLLSTNPEYRTLKIAGKLACCPEKS